MRHIHLHQRGCAESAACHWTLTPCCMVLRKSTIPVPLCCCLTSDLGCAADIEAAADSQTSCHMGRSGQPSGHLSLPWAGSRAPLGPSAAAGSSGSCLRSFGKDCQLLHPQVHVCWLGAFPDVKGSAWATPWPYICESFDAACVSTRTFDSCACMMCLR